MDGVETEVTATSGSDGYFEFTGLEEGTYYMKETTAPAGYVLNTTVYTIVISATYDEDGTLTNYTITVSDTKEAMGWVIVGTESGIEENRHCRH